MTQSLSLESRVARLEARNAITELSAQYAVACDVRDLDLLGSLFTEDAVLIDTAGRYTTQDSDAGADKASWLSFLDLLKKDKDVSAKLSDKELEELFDLGYHTKHVDTIFRRVFGRA